MGIPKTYTEEPVEIVAPEIVPVTPDIIPEVKTECGDDCNCAETECADNCGCTAGDCTTFNEEPAE